MNAPGREGVLRAESVLPMSLRRSSSYRRRMKWASMFGDPTVNVVLHRGLAGSARMWEPHGPWQGVESFGHCSQRPLRELLAGLVTDESLGMPQLFGSEAVGMEVARVILHPDFTCPSQHGLSNCSITKVIADRVSQEGKLGMGAEGPNAANGHCLPLHGANRIGRGASVIASTVGNRIGTGSEKAR
jgi:hypothetical protein